MNQRDKARGKKLNEKTCKGPSEIWQGPPGICYGYPEYISSPSST